MRIVQVIDSLAIGGAEKMAVNYCNELAKLNSIQFSGLVVTRERGDLETSIVSLENCIFLNKKNILDFLAYFKFLKFLKKNNITHIQAHSTSIYTAMIAKLFFWKIKIIWHDHYGMSDYLEKRNHKILKYLSFFFFMIISVNDNLKKWSLENLNCKNVHYIPNFFLLENTQKVTKLFGVDGKRILCLANLRIQKNHFLLLKSAIILKETHPDWTFHLVGKDFNDSYSNELKKNIKKNKLSSNVYLYDSVKDINYILEQVEIGVLTSNSEGLPLAILEYGFTLTPIIATNVGQIPELIQDGLNGFLINVNDQMKLTEKLKILIESENMRKEFSNKMYKLVKDKYSKEIILNNFTNLIFNTK